MFFLFELYAKSDCDRFLELATKLGITSGCCNSGNSRMTCNNEQSITSLDLQGGSTLTPISFALNDFEEDSNTFQALNELKLGQNVQITGELVISLGSLKKLTITQSGLTRLTVNSKLTDFQLNDASLKDVTLTETTDLVSCETGFTYINIPVCNNDCRVVNAILGNNKVVGKTSCCDDNGVTCNGEKVVKLDFSKRDFKVINNDWSKLMSLTHLNLSSNDLESVKVPPNVAMLDISENENLSGIQWSSHLEMVNMANCDFSNPPGLTSDKDLTIDISGNGLTTMMTIRANSVNLTVNNNDLTALELQYTPVALYASNNKIVTISTAALQSPILDLSFNKIKSLTVNFEIYTLFKVNNNPLSTLLVSYSNHKLDLHCDISNTKLPPSYKQEFPGCNPINLLCDNTKLDINFIYYYYDSIIIIGENINRKGYGVCEDNLFIDNVQLNMEDGSYTTYTYIPPANSDIYTIGTTIRQGSNAFAIINPFVKLFIPPTDRILIKEHLPLISNYEYELDIQDSVKEGYVILDKGQGIMNLVVIIQLNSTFSIYGTVAIVSEGQSKYSLKQKNLKLNDFGFSSTLSDLFTVTVNKLTNSVDPYHPMASDFQKQVVYAKNAKNDVSPIPNPLNYTISSNVTASINGIGLNGTSAITSPSDLVAFKFSKDFLPTTYLINDIYKIGVKITILESVYELVFDYKCNNQVFNLKLSQESKICIDRPTGCTESNYEAEEGYYKNLMDGLWEYTACTPQEACLGQNKCAEGYKGLNCGECQNRYYKSGIYCVKCNDNKTGAIAAASALVLIMLIGLYIKLNYGSLVVVMGILYTYFQILYIFKQLMMNWSDEVLQFFDLISFFSFNLELAQPECLDPKIDYFYKVQLVMLVPIILLTLILLCSSIYGAIKRNYQQLLCSIQSGIAVFHVILQTLYVTLCSMILGSFSCQIRGTDVVMTKFTAQRCYTEEYNKKLFWSKIGLLYVIGIPLYFIALYIGREQLKYPRLTAVSNWLLFTKNSDFKVHGQYIVAIHLVLKALIVASQAFLVNIVILQAIIIMLLIFTYLGFLVHTKPYLKRQHTIIDMCCQIGCIMVLSCGILFYVLQFGDNSAEFQSPLTFIVILVSAALTIIVLGQMKSDMGAIKDKKNKSALQKEKPIKSSKF